MSLAPGVTGAQAEDEPPAADLVERLDRLGENPGVVVERGQDPCSDLDLRGRGGDRPGHCETFPPALLAAALRPPEQLVGRPHRVEADRFRADRQVANCCPTDGCTVDERVAHGQYETDLK